MTATGFLILFLLFYTTEYVLNYWLDRLNISNINKHPNVPSFFNNIIQQSAYDKSRSYSLSKLRYNKWQMLFSGSLTLAVLFSGILPALQNFLSDWSVSSVWQGVFFFFILYAGLGLIKYPLGVYETFVIEGAYGFNKTTPKLYITDTIKTIILSVVLGVPILAGLLWFIYASGHYWWFWAWLFISTIQIILLVIYPIFLAPLFNKFKSLPDGELKDALVNLTVKLHFPIKGIFVMDGSRRSAHSNAYFTGFGSLRRIVLYDTLIEQMSVSEMETILAHEIGHYKKGHIYKTLIFNMIFLMGGLFILSFLINWSPLYQAFGFMDNILYVGLFLFSITFSSFTFFLGPIINAMSRKHEYEADAFAVQNSPKSEVMESALLKLAEKNASNLTPHPWYSAFHYSHPSIHERVLALRNLQSESI